MAEPLNGTFFAFRKREQGGVLLKASIAFAVGMLLLFIILGAVAWFAVGGSAFFEWYGDVMQAAANGQTGEPPMPPNLSGIFLLMLLYFIFLFVTFVLLAAYEATSVRWMVRGDRPGAIGLHFGHDMWRVYGTYWAWLLFAVLGWVAFAIVMVVVGVVAGNAGALGGWIALAVSAVFLLSWLYAAVRLSPAAATSIGVGAFQPFKAWRASRGRFWAIFGSYILISILYMIMYAVLGGLLFGAFYMQLFSGLDWSTAQTDPEGFMRAYEQASMQATQSLFSSPTAIATYIGGQVVMYAVVLVFYVLWFGVQSRVVQAALEEGKIQPAPAS